MRDRTVGKLLRWNFDEHPESTAVVVGEKRRTWAELAREVAAAAGELERRAIGRGDHVSLLLNNSIDWVVWALALGTLGVVLVPANTRLTPRELRYQLEQSDSRALIVPDDGTPRLLDLAAAATGADSEDADACPDLDQVISIGRTSRSWADSYEPGDGDMETRDQAEPDDVLLIQYTSGTTSLPKGAMVTHGSVLQDASGVAQRLHVDPVGDRFLSPSPFHHSGGSTLLLYLGLVTGVPIYTTPRFDPEELVRVIERERITMYGGIDALWIGLVKSQTYRPDAMSSVNKGWIAATPDVFEQIERSTGVEGLVNLYGLSEASPNVTISDVTWPRDQRMTCGSPHSGFEVRIVDPATRDPLPAETSGEIEVRGPCLMEGYYDKPEETHRVFDPEGWLRTGDRGHLRADGLLVYEGRYKDMLRVGGENVAAAEIESVILAHPDVADVAVVAIPHDRLGEVPAAVVQLKEGRSLEPPEITSFAEERLASFKVPRTVEIIEDFPRTGSGKIQKFRLTGLFQEGQ